jgi:cellobiose phosphorylase
MDLRIDIKGQRKDVLVCIVYTINQYIACMGDMKFLLKVPVSFKKKRLKMRRRQFFIQLTDIVQHVLHSLALQEIEIVR